MAVQLVWLFSPNPPLFYSDNGWLKSIGIIFALAVLFSISFGLAEGMILVAKSFRVGYVFIVSSLLAGFFTLFSVQT